MDRTRAFSRRFVAAFATMLFAAMAHGGPAQTVQSTLLVSAVVPRYASIRFAPPPSITITEDDVARGYVELAQDVEVSVQSNMSQGYTLAFEIDPGPVQAAQVLGFLGTLLVGSAGAIASRAATGTGMWRDRVRLRIRFELAAHAQPGPQPWPLRVGLMTQ